MKITKSGKKQVGLYDGFGDEFDRFHHSRWEYCNFLVHKELMRLKDSRLKVIFGKYSAVLLPKYHTVALTFPDKFEMKLPRALRLNCEPIHPAIRAQQKWADCRCYGINGPTTFYQW